MDFLLKRHDSEKGMILAACDKNLLGQEFVEGRKKLSINKDFYEGDEADLATILEALADCITANVVGEQLIQQLIDSDILSPDEIYTVDGIPHAHLYFI